ncbi:MAG: hypothetical protein MSA77_08655 [Selenomonadales bacterium]|nr:hypothetical protein [Selenomonadales bacterium]
MSLTLNLGKVSVSNSNFAASTVEFGGKSYTVANGVSVGLGDNGSLSLPDDVLTFVAGEGFSGALNTSGAAKGATLQAVDFSAAGGAVTFDTKNGTDVVTITGSAYNDKLTSNVNGAIIDGGEGDDSITFSGKTTVGATIEGGKGDDKISVTEMATVSISDAEGDDTYVISGKGANVTIDDAKGSDNVKISGASVTASVSLGGADNNVVLIDSSASDANVTLVTGDGDDVITSKAAKATLDITSAKGDDVITIAGKESNVKISVEAGDDVIDIAKGADKSKVAISVGAGDDIVKINAASVTGSVDGGANDDVLVIAGANASLTVDKVETVNLTGKNGKVSVTGGIVNSSAVGATINAATVNVSDGTAVLDNDNAIDELTISKGSVTANTVVTATVTGGTFTSGKDVDATDTIVINGSGAVVDAGAGVDTITVSEDATGTNTLTLGAGADVVSIDAGNSKVVITDLGIDDKLTLVDASEETTATLSKTGVLNIVDAGQYNVTANVYSGDYVGDDYAADIKNKDKNNVYHASVTAGDAGVIDLYTAAGTTKNVTVNATSVVADKTIIDLTAAKSSKVTVAGTKATTIALGNGKDIVSVGSTDGKTEISGYNFANKDAISVGSGSVTADDVVLNKDGKLTVDVEGEDDETGVFVTTTANNNVYAAKVNGADYYTAKTGAVKIATDKTVVDNVIDVAAASSSNINITNGAAKVTIKSLSEGADVINVAAGATVDAGKAVYDYADGDVINLGKATIAAGDALTTMLTTDGDVIGKLTVNNVTVGVSDLNDSLYAAKVVSNNNKKTTTYAVAVEDASVAIDLSASSFGDVVFDGSDAADVNVAIGAGDFAILSEGEDVITVNGLTKNTKDGVLVSNFDLDADKLVLSNVKLADMGVTSLGDDMLGITFGSKKSTVLVGADFADDAKGVAININGTDVKAAIADSATLTLDDDSKDAFFIGKDDTTLEVSDDIENTVIDLSDTNKYNNIRAVSVTEDATGISIIGTGNKKFEDSIDASANANGVQVSLGAGNKDSVTLSAGADVVWFDAKQGKDNVVTNFTYGTGENADVLNLSDVSSLDKVKFTTGTTLTVKDGSASANIAFVTAAPEEGASEIVKVQLSDGKIYNVAMDVNSEAGVALNLDDEIKVDGYVGKDVEVVLSSEDEVAYTYAKSSKEDVVGIDGSNTNGAMTIVGVENVTLGTSEEENANKVWAQGTATITATAAAGNDQVWFQSGVDKKVFVTGFADYSEDNDANDNIKLVGTKSVADIVSQYKLASKDDNVVITGVSSVASKLTVENTSTVVLTDDNGVSYVAKVGEKGDSDDFSTDVQIYAGMTELSSSNIEDDTVILLDGGSSTTFALNSDYYIGSSVTKFNAAGSTGNLVIVGGKTTKNELIGGEGDDLIYGGGASNDTMQGGEGSNTFFYGANDGKDVIEHITDEDTINLYSGNLVDLGYNEDKNAYIFTFEGGNTLTVNGDLAEGTMVQYAGATFVYQQDDHTFIQA